MQHDANLSVFPLSLFSATRHSKAVSWSLLHLTVAADRHRKNILCTKKHFKFMISESWQSAKHKLSEKLWEEKFPLNSFIAVSYKNASDWRMWRCVGEKMFDRLRENLINYRKCRSVIKIYVKQKWHRRLKTFKWDLFVIWSLLTSNIEGEEEKIVKKP